ncbi:hypothetical protein ACQKE4_20705, partial [Halomonas sp. NPDC076908]|uniref:hypothetical protein n=1 Tax=Halomonas sp. NPDC076908 TaxID=3390567 RepID=UPI003D047614
MLQRFQNITYIKQLVMVVFTGYVMLVIEQICSSILFGEVLNYWADADTECNTLIGWLTGFHDTWPSVRSSLLS